MAKRTRTPLFARQANSSPLGQLPYDILEEITEHLSRRDLRNLMLVSHESCNLAVRALYSTIPLKSTADHRLPYYILRRKQFSFLVAIAQHPEYTRFIRRISFEFTDEEDEPSDYSYPVPTDLVWKTFAKCQGAVYIDIEAKGRSWIDEPKAKMFPNLRRARVAGGFSGTTVALMLNTSSSLHALEVSLERREEHPASTKSSSPCCPGAFERLVPQLCSRSLRTLSIEIHGGELTSLVKFINHVSSHVTLLILKASAAASLQEDWTSWLTDVLNGFGALEELWLCGMETDGRLGEVLRGMDKCPKLKSIRHLEMRKCS